MHVHLPLQKLVLPCNSSMHVQMHPLFELEGVGIMTEIRNGVSADDLPAATWRKSSFSGAVGNCVELSWLDGQAGVRNSRDPHGPVLVVPSRVLVSFVTSAKDREA
jgi:hypothetical protein